MTTPTTNGAGEGAAAAAAAPRGINDDKIVMFFDIDNCLYSRNSKIQDMAAHLIDQYFRTHLSLTAEDSARLRKEYRIGYGIALQGLVANHKIDPLEYNALCDDALPLEDILREDPNLQRLFRDINRAPSPSSSPASPPVVVWLFTNAYVTHARRVARLLGVADLVDGTTFCDYSENPLVCKPDVEMYRRAMCDAGVTDPSKCFFVGEYPPPPSSQPLFFPCVPGRVLPAFFFWGLHPQTPLATQFPPYITPFLSVSHPTMSHVHPVAGQAWVDETLPRSSFWLIPT
jgi:pyrimidine and pyridine-specific 5'-nucleotidase